MKILASSLNNSKTLVLCSIANSFCKIPIKKLSYGLFFFSQDKQISEDHLHNSEKNIQEPQKQLRSISPHPDEGYAYGHYFPLEWSADKIIGVLDPKRTSIEKLQIVKTNVGQKSKKILIKFLNSNIRDKFISKYHEEYLMTDEEAHKVAILPFELRTSIKKKQFRSKINWNHGVRLSNIDFDMTENQLRKLAADYGQISHIQMNLRQKGINRGFATVYFENGKSATDFVNFMDRFMYRDRIIKAHQMGQPKEEKNKGFLEVPSFTFNANIELMKRLRLDKVHERD